MKPHWALDGKVAILRPQGDLMGYRNTDELVADARELVRAGNRALLVDMLDVPAVTSVGLAAFVQIQRAYGEVGGSVKVCNLNRRNHSLFEIVKFVKIFDLYDSEREGLRAFATELAHPAVG